MKSLKMNVKDNSHNNGEEAKSKPPVQFQSLMNLLKQISEIFCTISKNDFKMLQEKETFSTLDFDISNLSNRDIVKIPFLEFEALLGSNLEIKTIDLTQVFSETSVTHQIAKAYLCYRLIYLLPHLSQINKKSIQKEKELVQQTIHIIQKHVDEIVIKERKKSDFNIDNLDPHQYLKQLVSVLENELPQNTSDNLYIDLLFGISYMIDYFNSLKTDTSNFSDGIYHLDVYLEQNRNLSSCCECFCFCNATSKQIGISLSSVIQKMEEKAMLQEFETNSSNEFIQILAGNALLKPHHWTTPTPSRKKRKLANSVQYLQESNEYSKSVEFSLDLNQPVLEEKPTNSIDSFEVLLENFLELPFLDLSTGRLMLCGVITAKRRTKGEMFYFIKWFPEGLIESEWVKSLKNPIIKYVDLNSLPKKTFQKIVDLIFLKKKESIPSKIIEEPNSDQKEKEISNGKLMTMNE